MRIALGLEYLGTEFYGWQRQGDLRTLQLVVENAISKVAAHNISTFVAGRTDAGVHAIGQVLHFDTTAERSDRAWVMGVNTHLPKGVSIQWAKIMPDDFHARFSATARSYRYIIDNRSPRPALWHKHSAWHYVPLDTKRMHAAAQTLLGKHDFSAYRAEGCQAKSPIRTISNFTVIGKGTYVIIDITANAFLYHMVRNLVGMLMAIGAGEQSIEWAGQILESRDRSQGGITAPAYGLYFMKAEYPEVFSVPKHSGWIPTFAGF